MVFNFYKNIKYKQKQMVKSTIIHLIHEEFSEAWAIISQFIDKWNLGNDLDILWLTVQCLFGQNVSDQQVEYECYNILCDNEIHFFYFDIDGAS